MSAPTRRTMWTLLAAAALAPALLSTTTACLVVSVIDWPSARASWSVALPAANGTMKVIGLTG